MMVLYTARIDRGEFKFSLGNREIRPRTFSRRDVVIHRLIPNWGKRVRACPEVHLDIVLSCSYTVEPAHKAEECYEEDLPTQGSPEKERTRLL